MLGNKKRTAQGVKLAELVGATANTVTQFAFKVKDQLAFIESPEYACATARRLDELVVSLQGHASVLRRHLERSGYGG